NELTKYDEMKIDDLAKEKTVIYILLSDTNQTYNFLVAMYLEQMFQRLYKINDFEQPLKYPVRLMLDEFANIGRINQFEQRLATMRSRKISATIITQDLSQVETKYKKSWKSLIGNCDTFVYLGSNEKSTNEYVSKLLGKETIDTRNEGKSRGSSSSNSLNYQKLGRELLTPDELGNLDDQKNVTIIRGLDPFLDNKYPLHKHKRYKQLHDKPNDKKAINYILFKEQLIKNIINKREYISLEQKKEIKQRTKKDLKNQEKEVQETQNILSQIVEDRDLSFIPSSSELEKLKLKL